MSNGEPICLRDRLDVVSRDQRVFLSIICQSPVEADKIAVWVSTHAQNGFGVLREQLFVCVVEGGAASLYGFLASLQSQNARRVTVFAHQKSTDCLFTKWAHSRLPSFEPWNPNNDQSMSEVEELVWSVYERFLLAGETVGHKLRTTQNFTPALIKEVTDRLQLSPEQLSALCSELYPSLTSFLALTPAPSLALRPLPPNFAEIAEYREAPYTTYRGVSFD